MRISIVLLGLMIAQTGAAVCPTTLLYRVPDQSYVASWTADEQAIYVAQVTLGGPALIRRIDRETGLISEVTTVSNYPIGANPMLSVPPLLFYVGESIAMSPFDSRPAIVSIGPNGKSELARVERVGALRSDGKYLYWLVVSSTDYSGSTPVYRHDGEIRRMPNSGGPIETLASALLVVSPQSDFVVSGDSVVFLNGEGLFQVPKTGGTPQQIISVPDLVRIASADETGIIVTAIVSGEGLHGTDRPEVRRVSWSGGLTEILGFVTLPRFVETAVALVDSERIYFYVSGTYAQLHARLGGLFLIKHGVVAPFVTDPYSAPVPLDVTGGFLFGASPSFGTACCVIERMCTEPARGRITARR